MGGASNPSAQALSGPRPSKWPGLSVEVLGAHSSSASKDWELETFLPWLDLSRMAGGGGS